MLNVGLKKISFYFIYYDSPSRSSVLILNAHDILESGYNILHDKFTFWTVYWHIIEHREKGVADMFLVS